MTPHEVADKLTKQSKAALPHLNTEWSSGEQPYAVYLGAYSLGWGKDAKYGLIERRWVHGGARGRGLEVRLTPTGIEVRRILQERAND